MKYSLILIFLIISITAQAQDHKRSFEIVSPKGEHKTITIQNLEKYPQYFLDSVQITNHLKHYRSTAKKIKGVLLRDILADFSFSSESTKTLSEYYIVLVASDNCKVVFSWNELFNTAVGESAYIVYEIEDRKKDGIVSLSPNDYATGRRYVKMLKSIQLKRID